MKDVQHRLGEVMTPMPITLTRNDCLDKVDTIFEHNNFHHLPIVDEDGQLTGILSQTDFERLKHGATLFKIPNKNEFNQTLFRVTRVADVMVKDVVSLTPYDTITAAYRIFKANNFRAIPIVNKGRLVGIITPLDLLGYFQEKMDLLEELKSIQIPH